MFSCNISPLILTFLDAEEVICSYVEEAAELDDGEYAGADCAVLVL